MEAETALRLQAANDHLALAAEDLAAITAGPDAVNGTRLAGLQVSLAVRALAAVVQTIPPALLLPAPAGAGISGEAA